MNGRHCAHHEGDRQDGLGECIPEHCSAAVAGTPCPFLSEPCPWPGPCGYAPAGMQPDTERALKTAGRKVTEWTTERDRLVQQAVEEGGSLREVGAVAGISHTAVRFIAHGRP